MRKILLKIFSRPQLLNKIQKLKKSRQRIVFTNGCFDIVHSGHVNYLRQARMFGDFLVVALNSNKSVSRIKGKGRPIVHQKDRAILMASLEFVDAVVIFNEDTPINLIKLLKPDILVKGGDWKPHQVVGAKEVLSWGGRVQRIRITKGRSTTNLIKKIMEVYQVPRRTEDWVPLNEQDNYALNRIPDEVYQTLDANFNRCTEGLRVVEDILRFVRKNKPFTAEMKRIRHGITDSIKDIKGWPEKFTNARKSKEDVGKNSLHNEMKRENITQILLANIQRVKESLRVIEEFSKIIDKNISEKFKTIRFNVYEFEKKIISRL